MYLTVRYWSTIVDNQSFTPLVSWVSPILRNSPNDQTDSDGLQDIQCCSSVFNCLFVLFLVSEMVIEEVSVIQENLEIERACRENAEAIAAKVTSLISQTICAIFLCYWHFLSKPQYLNSSPKNILSKEKSCIIKIK